MKPPSAAAVSSEHARLADEHDAHGRHDEAVNSLARGTRAGDPECMTRLGLRLLIGDRAPPMPAEGARFIADAADRGSGEAGARLASLLAFGAFGNRDWNGGLQALARAAGHGWMPAREQLVLLAGSAAADEARERPDAPGTWTRVAASVDLPAWQAAPPGTDLHADPMIRRFDRFLPPEACAWLQRLARGRLVRAMVYDPEDRGRDFVSEVRTNSTATFNLAQVEFLQLLIQARMSSACGLPMDFMEAPVLLHYTPGQQFSEHYDFVDPQTPNYDEEIRLNGQRVITFLLYLNEDYEGGTTDFPELGTSHPGRAGEGLYFVNALPDGRPDTRTLHAGRPPVRGEKWVVSQFIRTRRLSGTLPETPRYASARSFQPGPGASVPTVRNAR